jgi:hypothetical protein
MLILEAQNVTPGGTDKQGYSNYRVGVWINNRPIWMGMVDGHKRDAGAAELLRQIAFFMDENPQ